MTTTTTTTTNSISTSPSPTATPTKYAQPGQINPADFHPIQRKLWRAIENAHSRAYWSRPAVVWLGGNEYAVISSDSLTTYHVILSGKNHLTGGEICLCKAGEDGMICYHEAAAQDFCNAEREAMEKCQPCKQPFAAALELTLSYSESLADSPPNCLRRGCANQIEDIENAFCDSCARDVALTADYPEASNWF